MRLASLPPLASLLLVAALVACGFGPSDALPRGVVLRATPPAADSTLDCPRLDGSYWVERRLIWGTLVRGRLSDDQRRVAWSVLRVEGDATRGLDLVVSSAGRHDTVRVERGRDYDCASGWLVPRAEIRLGDLPEEDSLRFANDPKHQRFEFGIAGDTTGALVGRLRTMSYAQFDVWCGDGCRGFPLPWTFEHRVDWEFLGPTTRPPAGVPDDDVNRRLAAEERALELGDQAVRPIPVERLVRAMMPPGSEILAVTPQGGGYRFSVLLPSRESTVDFVGRLINTQGLTGAHEEALYGAVRIDDPARRWQTVIWVPRPE